MGLATSITKGDGYKQIIVDNIRSTQWEQKRRWGGSLNQPKKADETSL